MQRDEEPSQEIPFTDEQELVDLVTPSTPELNLMHTPDLDLTSALLLLVCT